MFRCHAKGNDGPEELLFDHGIRISGQWRYGTDDEAENSFAEEICDRYVECRSLHSQKYGVRGSLNRDFDACAV